MSVISLAIDSSLEVWLLMYDETCDEFKGNSHTDKNILSHICLLKMDINSQIASSSVGSGRVLSHYQSKPKGGQKHHDTEEHLLL